jgi:hypothetical protein
LYGAGPQFRDKIKIFVNIKLFSVVGEKAVGLMPPVVLGAETPVNVWEDRFIFEVYCTEDAAAYFDPPLPMVRSREKTGL